MKEELKIDSPKKISQPPKEEKKEQIKLPGLKQKKEVDVSELTKQIPQK